MDHFLFLISSVIGHHNEVFFLYINALLSRGNGNKLGTLASCVC